MVELALGQRFRSDLRAFPLSLLRYLAIATLGALALTAAEQLTKKPVETKELSKPQPLLEEPASTQPDTRKDNDLIAGRWSDDLAPYGRTLGSASVAVGNAVVDKPTGATPIETLFAKDASGALWYSSKTLCYSPRDFGNQRATGLFVPYSFDRYDPSTSMFELPSADDYFATRKPSVPFLSSARIGPPRLGFPEEGANVSADQSVDSDGSVDQGANR